MGEILHDIIRIFTQIQDQLLSEYARAQNGEIASTKSEPFHSFK